MNLSCGKSIDMSLNTTEAVTTGKYVPPQYGMYLESVGVWACASELQTDMRDVMGCGAYIWGMWCTASG